jgi:hypothetical protein
MDRPNVADTDATMPRVRPLRHTFVPVRRSMIGTGTAQREFALAVEALVSTLAEARAVSSDPSDEPRLRGLLQRARRQLNVADEKLLMLDRRRQRSIFRRAERLREHLDDLHLHVACYYVERTFDGESGPCQTDLQSSGN